MIKYLTYNKEKFPFVISFSTLIEFQKRSGVEFVEMFSKETDMVSLAKNLELMVELGLKTGYATERPSFIRLIKNLIFSGSKIGVNKKNYIKVVDQQWKHLIDIIPDFFYDLNDVSADLVEEIIEDGTKKKS